MDQDLVSLIDEHNLSHKMDKFITMGIKTYKQMAQIQTSALKEDHLFTYADVRAFDALRNICIQRLEEGSQQQVKQRASTTESAQSAQIVSETGQRRKSQIITSGYAGEQLTNPVSIPPMHPYGNPRYQHANSGGTRAPLQNILLEHASMPDMNVQAIDQFGAISSLPEYVNPNYQQRYIAPQFQQQRPPPFAVRQDYPPRPVDQYQQILGPRFPPEYHSLPSRPSHTQIDQFQATREPTIREICYPISGATNTVRGIGIIFTNESFTNHCKREGARKDEINFKNLFSMMGLNIYSHFDLSTKEIIDSLTDISKRDLSMCEMFAIAFSTHGDKGDLLYGRDNSPFSLYKDAISLFKLGNCESLRGKPKLFFVQACRGDKSDSTSPHSGYAVQADSAERASVTLETDFLVAHSSVEGFKAYRHTGEGSWFVTQLKRAFDMYSNSYTMLDILSLANQLVVEKSIISSDGTDMYIQTCQFESTLTKLLKITPVRH